MRLRKAGGITLIEILIVIGILTIVMGIAYPVFSRGRVEALKVSCLARQKQLYQALTLYGVDNPGYERVHTNIDLPADGMRESGLRLLPYLDSKEMLFCPATPSCAREKWASTYVFSVGPQRGSSQETSASYQHNVKFEGDQLYKYPLIYTLIFDEMYYYPNERHLSPSLNPPFLTYVTADGAARKGRFKVLRSHYLAYACGDKY